MKLKFINGFLITALSIGAVGTFSSCKDTNEDDWNAIQDQIGVQYKTLTDKHNQDVAALNQALALLEQKNNDLQAQINALKEEAKTHATKEELQNVANALAIAEGKIANNENHIAAIEALLGEGVNGGYDTLAERLIAMEEELVRLDAYDAELLGKIGNLESGVGDLNTQVGDLNTQVGDLYNKYGELNTALDDTYALAVAANEKATANAEFIEAYKEVIEGIQDWQDMTQEDIDYLYEAMFDTMERLDTLEEDFNAYVEETNQALEEIRAAISPALEDVQQTVADLQNEMASALARISGLENRMKSAEAAIVRLAADLYTLTGWTLQISNRITSMIVEGASSPILGYLKTPVGIQSNILFNWYGYNTTVNEVVFPNLTSGQFSNNAGLEPTEYTDGYAFVDPALASYFENVKGNLTLVNGDIYMADPTGNLGSIYVNVNPVGIDMNGKDFTIVSSKGTFSSINVSEVKAYNGLLNFGYSRAEVTGLPAANGLYEVVTKFAKVETDANGVGIVKDHQVIKDLQYEFQPGLKDGVKELLQDRSRASLANMAKLMYEQFNADNNHTALPALAVNAAWTEEDYAGNQVNMSVNTGYSIAAAAIRPLSYKSFEGLDLSGYIRPLPNIDEYLDDFKFDLDGKFQITLDDIVINDISLDAPVITLDGINITVTIEMPVSANPDGSFNTETQTIQAENLDQLIEKINATLGSFTGSTEDKINAMLDNIRGQINNMIKSIKDQVDSSVASLQNEINGKIEKITNKISNFYDKIERVYNKVKDVVSNPNAYMQVMLVYKNGDNLHRVSNTKTLPTYLTGSGNAITLVPTTYNGEIVSPAFKKFVAVTNVYKSDDYSVNAANNDDCKKLMEYANTSTYMNQVVPGYRHTVAFHWDGSKPGYTYEITYQALDFRGYTSTQKFYFNIQ